MPDLTVEVARWCLSNEYDENDIGGYRQIFSRSNPGLYQYNWSCTCKGFMYRKTCKHVEWAEKHRCAHGWEASAGSPIEMGKTCPECGGATSVVSYAV